MSATVEATPVDRTAAVSSLPKGESCVLVIFGASAPIKDLLKHFGFTPERVVDEARSLVKR